ncbi:CorA metal ion transporter [Lecanora helva]
MASRGSPGRSSTSNPLAPQRPTNTLLNTQSTTDVLAAAQMDPATGGKRRKNHRGGKKRKNRRQSFLPGAEGNDVNNAGRDENEQESHDATASRPPFYRLGQSGGRNLSETSLDSNALLDHRDHPPMRQRRESRVTPGPFGRAGQSNQDLTSQLRQSYSNRHEFMEDRSHHHRAIHPSDQPREGSDAEDHLPTDTTPLLASNHDRSSPSHRSGYAMLGGRGTGTRQESQNRRHSTATSTSSRHRRRIPSRQPSHDVNNPPSVPNSPRLGLDVGLDDVLVSDPLAGRSEGNGDQLIDIDGTASDHGYGKTPPTPRMEQRRHTISVPAEEDVCFPIEGMSTIGEEEYISREQEAHEPHGQRRRRFRQFPDLSVLDEWSREEKEQRSEGIRTKKISEPILVNGRLRPQKHGWHRTQEDAPYRFTYFNEEFENTIHSETISELVQPGQDFKELFIPDPPELSDDSSDEEDTMSHQGTADGRNDRSSYTQSRLGTRHSSIIGENKNPSAEQSGEATPSQSNPPGRTERPKRYGERPTWWLDVLSPTETEMRVISKTFGIHPLTAEDIIEQEPREKVELFRNYYFVNYRTFDQDTSSEDYLEPVNMYVVVFREGVISFHFSQTPHPNNVRRRIRQLKEYLILSADWISYAIIDDVTDVFAPLIQSIEEEVDDIDDTILALHSGNKEEVENEKVQTSNGSDAGGQSSPGSDMLRRVGEGRKKVMRVNRLLGNKADVIKGFAKRCNERWEIAPRSDIGMYLGDIQDHILTMTSNLSHYETLLSRAHSNYLAQINIRMNERQEQTADVLGKLTVLGTIVLPMNIVTGMWGMNVLVPGQDVDNLYWFWSITAGLFVFGISCFFIAKRVYGIV